MTARARLGFVVLALLALALPALAQNPRPTFIRGKITSLESHALTIATREGGTVTVQLADPFTVMAVKPVDLASIDKGAFVGIAAVPTPGGSLKAQEVLVFPEAMRGTGEGSYAWDLTPSSTMTNATVTGVVQGREGHELSLTYKDGSKTILVPANAPVVTLIPAQPADAKPGVPVFLGAAKKPDGSLAASRITIGKDGVAPPM